MRSCGKGSLSAATQVKVLSLEIFHIATGQGFHYLETRIGTIVKGKIVTDVPGSKSVAGKQKVYVGTWENQTVPQRSSEGVEEMTKEYDGLVVGLTHIRGVNRVMPIESQKIETLEGVSSLMERDEDCNAVH